MRARRSLTLLGTLALLALAHGGTAKAAPPRGQVVRPADATRPVQRSGGRSLGRVTKLRQQSDRLTHTIRRGAPAQQQEALVGLEADVSTILDAIEDVQTHGTVDPISEHRAMAAVSRALLAANEQQPGRVSDALADRFDAVFSRAAYRRKADHHETAVEIETRMSDRILDAITTRDGTVGALLKDGGKPAPEFLTRMAGDKPVEDLAWDQLDRHQKLDLLRSQSKGRRFFIDRQIPGVVFRRSLKKSLFRRVKLGGRTAGFGSSSVPVDGLLMEKVEYVGPKTVDSVGQVEMHIRQPGRATHNAKEAFKVVDLLDSRAIGGHQHIPHRLPRAVLEGDPVARAELVDFYRRANMVGELASVLDGYRLTPVGDGMYFDYLAAPKLTRLDEHLASISSGRGPGMWGNSELKMAAVGFRPGSLYGDDSMFGFEVRVLDKKRTRDGDRFVDAIQKGVVTGRYGLPRSAIKSWRARAVKEEYRQGEALASLHYNQSVDTLLAHVPAALADDITPKVANRIRAEAPNALGVKMLVHDWSTDPVLFGKDRALAQVVVAQRHGLRRLAAGGKPHEVTQEFARESGLYELFTDSIGMNDPALR